MSWGTFWYPHTVTVRDLLPSGGLGGGFGAPRTLAAEVLDRQELVRDASGAEVVSSSQVSLPLPEHVPVGSLVTVWPGLPQEREARVLSAAINPNDPPLDAYLLLSLE
ncbi:hypothetical protein H5399_05075 [Tessaracoccus sp. MC1627]|uniref:hypothetical protein n=1 Tax=Tessaracoccus sp. MC1627 TaxID=2760312 RepID=UPI00160048E7|nr:hypothetical protein [Tessaracoccus sp. MC1627]MBB1511976.1 hypothetical protein [Tessaracoccus sp. MC1627]